MQAFEGELGSRRDLPSACRIVIPQPVQDLEESRHRTQLPQQVRRGNQITGLDQSTLGKDLREAG